MSITVLEESASALTAYAKVSIAFDVTRRYRLEVVRAGLGGLVLVEEPVAPYIKDYDARGGGGPASWPCRWDVSAWGLLAAHDEGGARVGGAAVAWKTAELVITGNPAQTAVLWDLRVDHRFRRRGVATLLFSKVRGWCLERGIRRIEVETQNTNVPACRFYASQGCELVAIDREAYGEECDEVRLVWADFL
jgi:GNAT superfamily N-acetyltransferase